MNQDDRKYIGKMLLYYSLKYKGDWELITQAINFHEEIDNEFLKTELKKINFKYVTIVDEEYPSQFKAITRPPYVIYYYGDFNLASAHNILAIVGSRNPTIYGIKVCKKIINELDIKDLVIVSGLAKGIDALSHELAFINEYKTIAVLGSGIDSIYPKENYYLYKKIKMEGLLISEYPYKGIVSKENFALRNRLISALSKVVFIPDVNQKSGTSLTVRFALEQGKDIAVVPNSIFDDLYNNRLIFEGATPIITSEDLKELFF